MKSKKIIEAIKSQEGLPFNYKYLDILMSNENPSEHEIRIVKVIPIKDYQTSVYEVIPHWKPISKIIDFSAFIEELKND